MCIADLFKDFFEVNHVMLDNVVQGGFSNKISIFRHGGYGN